MDYEHQEKFADYVKYFVKKYGITQQWVANQTEISISSFKKFTSSYRPLSKKNYYRLYWFIKQYEKCMEWLRLDLD